QPKPSPDKPASVFRGKFPLGREKHRAAESRVRWSSSITTRMAAKAESTLRQGRQVAPDPRKWGTMVWCPSLVIHRCPVHGKTLGPACCAKCCGDFFIPMGSAHRNLPRP